MRKRDVVVTGTSWEFEKKKRKNEAKEFYEDKLRH